MTNIADYTEWKRHADGTTCRGLILRGKCDCGAQTMTDKTVNSADVFFYLDLFARRAGVDFEDALVAKFNEISERNGFPERLWSPSETKALPGNPGEILGCTCMMCEFHRSAEAIERQSRAVNENDSPKVT